MPLVRISLRVRDGYSADIQPRHQDVAKGKSAEYGRAVGDAVHRAMVETINVPPLDRFQIITEYPAENFIHDANYLDIARSDDLIIIQITLNVGRTTEMKRALYARSAEMLAKSPGVRTQDVFISLVEVARENWSFGNGVAQYAT